MQYVVVALGIITALALVFLAARFTTRQGRFAKRTLSWRRSELYSRFVATMSREHVRHYLSLNEDEQYRLLMEWCVHEEARVQGSGA